MFGAFWQLKSKEFLLRFYLRNGLEQVGKQELERFLSLLFVYFTLSLITLSLKHLSQGVIIGVLWLLFLTCGNLGERRSPKVALSCLFKMLV